MDEMMRILSVVSFLSAGVCGMVSVVLWLRFDIPGIVGELSGRAARREIRRKRRDGEPDGSGRRKSPQAGEREGERGSRRGRKDPAWSVEETEQLERRYSLGGEEAQTREDGPRHVPEDNVMIIHTDEEIAKAKRRF